jgi:RNA polymerase sigma factor (sigma-70 family)
VVTDRKEDFHRFAFAHFRELRRVALRVCQEREAADDLVQETYLRAWRSFDKFEPGTNCRAWLFRIFFHVHSEYRRNQARQPLIFSLDYVKESKHSSQITLPAVEVIAERRRFSDGVVTLDLLNVPSPHVDEMVVAFIPSAGIVYVADGFTRDFGPWRPPTIDERTLVRQFKQLGLDIRIVLPGHGPAATKKDLEQYLSSSGFSLRADDK